MKSNAQDLAETTLRPNSVFDRISISLVVALLLFSGVMTFLAFQRLQHDRLIVSHTHEVISKIADIQFLVKDSESGQRGFLITGVDSYLEPFEDARTKIDEALDSLTSLTADSPAQTKNVRDLRETVKAKIAELELAIQVRKGMGIDSAIDELITNVGKQTMEKIRDQIEQIRTAELRLLSAREYAAMQSYRLGLFTTVLSTIVGLALVAGLVALMRRKRQRAEWYANSIHDERERLRITLSSIGDGVIATDRNSIVTYMNPVAEELTGWTGSEATGAKLEDVFHIIDERTREKAENPVARAIRDDMPVSPINQTQLISRSGNELPIEDSAAPILDSTGNIAGVVLVFRDVTERREEGKRLANLAAFMRRIIDSLSEMVMVLDRDLKVLSINRVAREAFLVNEEEAIGQSIFKLGGQAFAVKPVREFLAGIDGTESKTCYIELDTQVPKLGTRDLLLGASAFEPAFGKRGSILLVISDLTEERELERKNQLLDQHMKWFLEQLQDYAIFTMDKEFRATSWNQGVKHVLGYEEDEFLGQDVRYLIFPQEALDDGSALAEFTSAIQEGSANDDRWMLRKGNVMFWAAGITSTIVNDKGEMVGYSKLMRDQTNRKQAQDELAELAAKLSEADRRKNEFLATLAHELRNPLAPIKNAVQLMEMSTLDPDTEELRQTMARQVDQLVHLIDDLLDISRISRGKIVLRNKVINLESIVKAAAEESKPLIDENGQVLKTTFDGDSIYVNADSARITQVISNLLNNASKYSGDGCTIDLRVSAENNQAVVQVRDNGIGIEADRLEEIFEMFGQLDDSLERGSIGLGIGLTLVKTLVELHGGTVTAESDGKGKGSRFTVRLPLTHESAKSDIAPKLPASVPSGRNFQILIVEDQRALRVVLGRLLTAMGHTIVLAENGADAIEKLKSCSPEIIFSDISMPGMTGYELVKRLRKRPDMAQTFFVAMTGFGLESDRAKAIESGFHEHIVKPVDVERLKELFETITREG